jgi:hypothetical protein
LFLNPEIACANLKNERREAKKKKGMGRIELGTLWPKLLKCQKINVTDHFAKQPL